MSPAWSALLTAVAILAATATRSGAAAGAIPAFFRHRTRVSACAFLSHRHFLHGLNGRVELIGVADVPRVCLSLQEKDDICRGGLTHQRGTEGTIMSGKEKITDGANERAIDESIAGTAPGIPDDAQIAGEELPEPPSDEEVARIARKLGAPVPVAEGRPDVPGSS